MNLFLIKNKAGSLFLAIYCSIFPHKSAKKTATSILLNLFKNSLNKTNKSFPQNNDPATADFPITYTQDNTNLFKSVDK